MNSGIWAGQRNSCTVKGNHSAKLAMTHFHIGTSSHRTNTTRRQTITHKDIIHCKGRTRGKPPTTYGHVLYTHVTSIRVLYIHIDPANHDVLFSNSRRTNNIHRRRNTKGFPIRTPVSTRLAQHDCFKIATLVHSCYTFNSFHSFRQRATIFGHTHRINQVGSSSSFHASLIGMLTFHVVRQLGGT